MKSFIIGLIILLGISNYAEAQFFVVQPQVRYYNNGYNYGYNYRFNNNGFNYGYNYGYNNYGYNNGFNRYITPSGYMPFNNPYFRMATQGIGGYGW